MIKLFFYKKCGIFFKGLANSSNLPYVTQEKNKSLRKSEQSDTFTLCGCSSVG
ncbi:hypothetical protein Q655_00285 [Bartonella henselae JK 51]|nr:hypothetical protein Q653_00872 [Bartonella henselae JK 42]ETS10054.1 hypothetical protein Q654_00334 [Bartonella henselae JK 50]ETS10564.1 hypothetical protein Q655_00285 [Bartonella henselae JK 51]ETS12197.1 hypothetical protein Q652_01000 [Bartonella henselae JK 41]KEC58098.1 hypothetical protein O97_00627 [Bartonella henselae str. Zeus]KEC62230.1 hypothetical protein O95_00692 [Bartonella henselae JK 53]